MSKLMVYLRTSVRKFALAVPAALLLAALAPLGGHAWADETPADNGGSLVGGHDSAPAVEAPGAVEPAAAAPGAKAEDAVAAQPAPQERREEVRPAQALASQPSEPAAEASGPALAVQSSTGTPLAVQAEPDLAAQAEPSGPADGEYAIRSDVAERSVLDVAGGSAASGANVQLYTYNGTKAQRWRIARDKASGLYTVINLVSGKALDVSGAGTRQGTNVQVYNPNGTRAQLWRLVADGQAWRFESALRAGVVLDISGASSADGTNAQVWTANGTAAQRFFLVPYSASAVGASTAKVAEGAYVVRNAGSGKVLDVSGGSRGSGANAQQWAANSTYAQRFYFEKEGGYYRIYNVGSGLALDVSGADPMPRANVQQWSANGTAAQLWSVRANGDGTVTFLTCAGGNALDVSGASHASGANVQTWAPNGTAAQRFKLEPVALVSAGGAVALYSALAPSRGVDVPGASAKSGAALQLYDHNSTAAQRFRVEAVDGGIALSPVCSGLYVGASASGSAVQSGTKAVWALSFSKSGSRRGVVLALKSDGRALTAASGSQSAALKVAAARGNAAQAFLPEVANATIDGYFIISASDGRVLDIAGGSYGRGANVQVYAANGTGAQVFYIEPVGTDLCRIVSSKTYQALDAQNGGTADGTNVWQYGVNGTNAQLWRMSYDAKGRAIFKNAKSGKLLTMSGSNVCIKAANGSASQTWGLKRTNRFSQTGNEELDRAVANILADHNSLHSAYDFVAYSYNYREGNKHWSGYSLSDNTSRNYALDMYYNGSGNCYRFASLFAWCAKALGYSNVVVRTGWVVGYSAPQAPHGWVEIDGHYCDPDMQHEMPSRNWYWQTWASAPTAYYSW